MQEGNAINRRMFFAAAIGAFAGAPGLGNSRPPVFIGPGNWFPPGGIISMRVRMDGGGGGGGWSDAETAALHRSSVLPVVAYRG